MPISRRNLILGGFAAAGLPVALAACGRDGDGGQASATTTGGSSSPTSGGGAATLAPTPACGDDPTPTQTEGPFFTSGSPDKANLAADVSKGTKLALTGTVLTTACQPVKGAKLDFWQADDDGDYDNQGYRLRGHVFTDDQGRYQITTVMPGVYPGRTRHIHVKAQAPGGRPLTTQLYFPGEAANARDGIYRKECEVVMTNGDGGSKQASFTFVLRA
jgi:protocatechuate 3,4-dioxygenase beta subunit